MKLINFLKNSVFGTQAEKKQKEFEARILESTTSLNKLLALQISSDNKVSILKSTTLLEARFLEFTTSLNKLLVSKISIDNNELRSLRDSQYELEIKLNSLMNRFDIYEKVVEAPVEIPEIASTESKRMVWSEVFK